MATKNNTEMNPELNQDLILLADHRNILSGLTYDAPSYDQTEDDLHEMEDKFIEKHGAFLESILEQTHKRICPETDVLLPIAYLAHKYSVRTDAELGQIYEVNFAEGVPIEAKAYEDQDARLVLLPSPLRLLLTIKNKRKEVVWKA